MTTALASIARVGEQRKETYEQRKGRCATMRLFCIVLFLVPTLDIAAATVAAAASWG